MLMPCTLCGSPMIAEKGNNYRCTLKGCHRARTPLYEVCAKRMELEENEGEKFSDVCDRGTDIESFVQKGELIPSFKTITRPLKKQPLKYQKHQYLQLAEQIWYSPAPKKVPWQWEEAKRVECTSRKPMQSETQEDLEKEAC